MSTFLRIFTHSHRQIINFSEKLRVFNKHEGFNVIFTNDELDLLMVRLRNQLWVLLIRYPGDGKQNKVKGILGEKFVRYCIGHSMWKLGYCLGPTPHPRSYSLALKYGCNGTGHGGMDILLMMVDEKGIAHTVLIEVKNWKHYDFITPDTFRKKILCRFRRVDRSRNYPWVLAMNTRNIPLIESRCRRHHIQILPIVHHITPESIGNDDVLRDLFSSFIDAFCTFITDIIPEEVYPYLVVENGGRDATVGIIQDLFLGVPYDVITIRYDVTSEYVMRLASELRGAGVYLPDRREEEWVVQRVIQE